MELEFIKNENKLTVKIIGQLDTNTSPELEKHLNEIISCNEVVIDAKELTYISSFGLRMILKIKKSVDNTTIINVSNDVYEVFEMTGFSEMMKIEKRMREISVEGCKIVGKGAVGTVYRIADDTIVKVYRENENIDDINKERELARHAFVLGIPTAIAYDIVKVGNRYGSVFELLNAKALSECIIEHPEKLDDFIDWYVDVLKTIHSCEITDGSLPNKKVALFKWLDSIHDVLSIEYFNKLYKLINNIQDDNHIIHGDYHIKNILVQNGEPFIIDMDKLSLGSPIIEFGFLYFSYQAYSEFDENDVAEFFGLSHETIDYIFLETCKRYFINKNSDEINIIIDKARIIAYLILLSKFIRHNENIQHVPMFVNKLCVLLDKYDDLNI